MWFKPSIYSAVFTFTDFWNNTWLKSCVTTNINFYFCIKNRYFFMVIGKKKRKKKQIRKIKLVMISLVSYNPITSLVLTYYDTAIFTITVNVVFFGRGQFSRFWLFKFLGDAFFAITDLFPYILTKFKFSRVVILAIDKKSRKSRKLTPREKNHINST